MWEPMASMDSSLFRARECRGLVLYLMVDTMHFLGMENRETVPSSRLHKYRWHT